MTTNPWTYMHRRRASQKLWLLAFGILLAGCNRLFLG
jgi:hypothetical protein